jgi:glycosyltransferase involved in cell wall biosynthesis
MTHTIIVPVYNEELHLERVLNKTLEGLTDNALQSNIIIVNDGSTDASKEIIEKVIKESQYPGTISSIHMTINKGIGGAYKEALKIVSTDFVTWIPSDGEIPLEPLFNALKRTQKNELIISYPDFEKNPRSPLRLFLSKLYTLILNISFRLDLKYYNGFTIYPTYAIKEVDVISERFAFNAEALIKVLYLHQLDYQQVSFNLSARISGDSKAITSSSLKDILKFYLRTLRDIYFYKTKRHKNR